MNTKQHVVRSLLVLVTLALPLPALARPAAHPVAGGLGGFTFGAGKGGSIDGDFGVDVNSHVRISADVGRLTSILPTAMSTDIKSQADAYALQFNDTATTTSKLHASTFGANVQLRSSSKRNISGFVEGGFGAARLNGSLLATMTDPLFGATSSIASQITAPIVTTPSTKGMFDVGGGVTFALDKRVGLDVGYRYGRVMGSDPINTGRVYSGLQFRF